MTDTANTAFSALEAAELAVVAAPFLTVLNNLKNSDGSKEAIAGQGIVLEGELLAALPTIQKVGVQNIAGDLINFINGKLAEAATAPVTGVTA